MATIANIKVLGPNICHLEQIILQPLEAIYITKNGDGGTFELPSNFLTDTRLYSDDIIVLPTAIGGNSISYQWGKATDGTIDFIYVGNLDSQYEFLISLYIIKFHSIIK